MTTVSRRRVLRSLSVLASGSVVASLLQACGTAPTSTPAAPTPATQSSAPTNASAAPSTAPTAAPVAATPVPAQAAAPTAATSVNLVYWTGWSLSKSDVRGKYTWEVLDAYQQSHPGVKFSPVEQPFANYPEIFRAMVVSKTGPDVAVVWPGQFLLDYEQAWLPLQLTPQEKAQITDLASVSSSFDPNKGPIYAIPWGMEMQYFLFNKELFTKAGLDPTKPPATWSDFSSACATLKKAGITPLAVGAKGGDTIDGYMSQAMPQLLDPGDGAKMNSGSLSMTDPRVAGFFGDFIKLVQSYAEDGYRTMPYFPQSIDYMAAGKAAIVLGWFSRMVYVAKGLGDNGFGIFRFPTLPNATHPETGSVAAGGAYVATKFSKHPDEALKAATWLGNKDNQEKMLTDLGIIPARKDMDPSKAKWPQMRDALKNWVVDGKTVSTIDVYRLPPEGSTELHKQTEMVLIGEATPPKALQAVDAAVKNAKH